MRIVVLVGLVIGSQPGIDDAFGSEPKESGYIAGLKPNQRPAGATTISRVQKGDDWYKKALTGIDPPYPPSIRFLEDQGNWYTPFNRPGMTGRYDIRGWHKK